MLHAAFNGRVDDVLARRDLIDGRVLGRSVEVEAPASSECLGDFFFKPSALTSSAPAEARACAFSEEGVQVTARAWKEGFLRRERATAPPWFPRRW